MSEEKKPWEKYSQQTEDKKPWEKYSSEDAVKKKEPTASLSPSGQKPTSSVTPAKKEQKPSVSSGGKPEGLYSFPGNEFSVYKKKGNEWFVDTNRSGNFIKLYKGDVDKRISNLEKNSKKLFDSDYEKNLELKFTSTPDIQKEKKNATVDQKQAQDLFKKSFNVMENDDPIVVERKKIDKISEAASKYVNKSEEESVYELSRSFKDIGYDLFDFEEAGMGNMLKITNKKTLQDIVIDLDGTENEKEIFKSFIKSNLEFRDYNNLVEKRRYLVDELKNPAGRPSYEIEKEISDTDSKIKEQEFYRKGYALQNNYNAMAMYGKKNATDVREDTQQNITRFVSNSVVFKDDLKKQQETDEELKNLYVSGQITKEKYDEITNDESYKTNKLQLKERYDNLVDESKTIMENNDSMEKIIGEASTPKELRGDMASNIISSFASGFVSLPKMLKQIDDYTKTPTYDINGKRIYDESVSRNDAWQDLLPGIMSDEYTKSAKLSDVEKVLAGMAESIGAAASMPIGGAVGSVATSSFWRQGGIEIMKQLGKKAVLNPQQLGLFANSYLNFKDQINSDPDTAGIDEADKILLSGGYGYISSKLESLGMSKWFSKSPAGVNLTSYIMAKAFKDLPKDATEEMVDKAVKTNVNALIAKGVISLSAKGNVEASTEALQELGDIGIKYAYNEMKDQEVFKNPSFPEIVDRMSESYKLGLLGGTIMSSTTQAISTAKEVRTANQINTLEKIINDPNVKTVFENDLKTKILNNQITVEQAKDQIDELNSSIGLLDKIPANVTDKTESFKLLAEKQRLENEISGKDESLVSVQKARISEINNKLTQISEDANKKDNIQQQEGTTEGSTVEYQGTSEGQQKVGQGEGIQREATVNEANTGDSAVESISVKELGAKATQEVSNYISELGSNERIGGTIDSVMAKMNNAEYINDSEINSTIDTIFSEVESINNDANYSDQTKKSLSEKLMNIAEQLDNYEFRTKTETIAVTQRGTAPVAKQAATAKISAEKFFEGQTAEVNGVPATFKSNKGRTEAVMDNGETVVLDTPTMKINEGDFEFDDAGNLAAVTVTDRFGTTAKFTGDIAMDLAIKQRENEIGTVEQADFDTVYKEVETKYVKETSKSKEATNSEKVKTLRAQEQQELNEAIPNIEEYKVDGEINKESMPADVLAKYNEIYNKYDAKITPLLPATKTATTTKVEKATPTVAKQEVVTEVKPAAKTVEQEVEEIGKLLEGSDIEIDRIANTIPDKRMAKIVARAAKAISKIIPGTKFVVHDTNESFVLATGEGKTEDVGGVFDPKTNTIHINVTKANRRTVAHEVFHAILINKVKTDANAAAVTKRMVQAISAKIENNPALKKKLDDFISNYEENIQNEEKVAELVGILAENYNSMSASIKDLLARWIDKLANMFGLDPFDRNETYDMLNTIARKVAKGKVISEADVKVIPSVTDKNGNLEKPSESSIKNLKNRKQNIVKETKDSVIEGPIVSTRLPKANDAYSNDKYIVSISDLENIASKDAGAEAQYIKIAKEISGYNISKIKNVENIEDAKKVILDFKESIKLNLKWLYNSFGNDVRDISKLWYDGANKICNNISSEYNYSLEQVSGVMAVLSPQMDWFRNLSLGERVIDIYSKQQSSVFDSKMIEYVKNASSGTGKNKVPLFKDSQELISRVKNKKLSELNNKDKAYFIRVFDEVYNPREYNNISPNGLVNGLVRKKDGTPGACGWGAFPTIEKSISILQDGSIKNISSNLGNMHKVRNFFNNISNPNDVNAVTIDTHAVAAALLLPLSGSSKQVLYNFGGAGNVNTGMTGTYPVYADAYRELANELNLLPREVQSINWEAVRGLFKATFKSNKSNESNVNDIWNKYSNNEISLDDAHSQISNIAGGISKPVWFEYLADNNAKSLDKNSAGVDQASLDNEEVINTTKRKQKPVAGNKLFNEPLKDASTIADRYAKKSGITMQEVVPVTSLDKENSKAISDEFEKMKDDPTNPEVAAAYNKMAEETIAQYKEIVNDGYFVEINNEEPYSSSEDMIKDLKENKRFKVYSTESGFGDNGITEKQRSENPLLKDSGFKDVNGETLLVNDVFRFVHDFFGHAKFGNSFGPIGEENAWMIHSVMYSPLARRAMTSETRGQNSYVNFSGVNEEAFRLRDKARALRQEGKIEQANKLVEKVYDIMKFADQKVGLMPEWVSGTGNIDGAVKARKQKPSNINAVIKLCKENGFSNEAITKYLKDKGFSDEQINNSLAPYIAKENAKNDFNIEYSRLIDEGATEENAFNESMENIVYKMEDDILREEVARELMKDYDKKTKSAPSVGKILDKKAPITITTNDVKGLTDIIKREAKAAKDKKKQVKEVLTSIADQVKDMVTKGKINIRQMSAIINALKNTNFDNQLMVDRFMDYVLKVVSNADYIERVSNGINFKKAIKRNLKGKANPFVSVAKSFTELNPKWVVDINKYNEIAELVLNSVKSTRITKDIIKFKKEADIDVIAKYIAEEQENHLKMQESNLRDRYERITEESSEGKTIEEMNTVLLNLKDKKDYSNEIANELKNKLEEYKKMVTNDDLAEVKAAVNVDLNLIDNKMAIRILDALDTYFANESNASLKDIMATYNGIVAAKEFKGKARPLRMLGSKKIGRVQNEQFTNINMMFKRLFTGQNAGQAFSEAIGFNNLVKGSNRAERQSLDKQNEYTKKFKNIKNFNSAENIFERNVISWLRRRDVNANEQDSFNKRLKLLKDSVDVLRKSGTSTEIAKADMYEKVFKKLGLYDDNINIDGVLSKSEKFNIEAADFVMDMFSEIYPQLKDTALGVYNTMLANDINYTPDKFTNLDSSIPSEFDLDSSGFMSFNSNYTLDKNSAGVLIETTRPSKLPANMYIDLDFDRNMFRSYKLALNDIYTAEAIRYTNAFLKSDNFAEIIPTAEDRRIVVSAIQGYVSAKKGKNYIEKSEMDFFNSFLDAVGGFGAARALAGFSQFVNQWGTANVNTLANAGEHMRPGDLFNKEILEMIADSGLPISNVGIDALTTIENADKELEKAGIVATVGGAIDKYTLSYLKKWNSFLLKQLLANPDRFARIQAFAAYYRQSMAQQKIKVDWKKPNQKALKYAQSMIDANMDVSDTEMRGQFFKSKNAYVKIIKQVFFPFATFSMNQRNRVWSDISVVANKNTSLQDRLYAIRSLTGFTAEFAAYNSIRYYVGLGIISAASGLLGLDDEDEEKVIEKYKSNLEKSIFSSSITDVISPTPILDDLTLSTMNKMIPMFGIGTPSDEDFNKYIDELNKNKLFKGQDVLTDEEIASKKDKFMLENQFQFFIDKEKSSGMLGIQLTKIEELSDIIKAYNTGKYTRKRYAGGGYEEVNLSDEAKDKLKIIALLKLEGTLIGPRETDQIANRMFKIVKDTETLSENQKVKYDEIKKQYKIDPYKLSLIKTTMKTENILNEIEYIESNGGLTEKQSKEYAKLREIGEVDVWDLEELQKGKTASEIVKKK